VQHDVLRIIDANANRAREALRVMEDAARFLLDDAALTEDLKNLRHDLVTALLRFDSLEHHRRVQSDVGRAISVESEMRRAGAGNVAIAAGKRLSEALRAMEEYGKVVDSSFALMVEQLRYRGYELEQRLTTRLASAVPKQWRVCIILTESLCARPWREVVSESIDAGADCIQLREKELGDRALLERAADLLRIVNRRAAVIINDRPDIALLCGADGVHLGQNDLPAARVREIAGRRLIVGVSTSCLSEAQRAFDEGADYCGAGPMFPSTTKRKESLAGPDYLREYLAWGRLPHLAIGGITPDNISELAQLGCRGVAVSSAACAAADPGAVVRTLREALARV